MVYGVEVHIQAFGIGEMLPTDFALVWLLSAVDVRVFQSTGNFSEDFIAYLAFVTPVTSYVSLYTKFRAHFEVAEVTSVVTVFAVGFRM